MYNFFLYYIYDTNKIMRLETGQKHILHIYK